MGRERQRRGLKVAAGIAVALGGEEPDKPALGFAASELDPER